MLSRAKVVALALLFTVVTPIGQAADAVKSDPSAGTTPSQTAIDAAVADLRHDPNLGGQTKVRTLRWVAEARTKPAATPPSWLLGLFDYLGQVSGLLLWVAGALAVAAAAVWLLRMFRARIPQAVEVPPEAALRRVLDLDIRPDSLPQDVGATALELLRAGRVRDSLSLLYRASLSSAVHRFGVKIGAQHTEREVLGAIRLALDEPRARYFAELVATWQQVVYAGEILAPDAVAPLCTGFPMHFDPPPP